MPTQSFTQTRRDFLKSTACASALAITGVAALSGLAVADATNGAQHQTGAEEVINLINHTASTVALDGVFPVSIAPGEQLTLTVAMLSRGNRGSANKKSLFITDVLTDDQLAIRSDYPEFNGVFPVTKFGMLAA